MVEDGPGRGHLCHTDTFLVYFQDKNLSKSQWIFNKLDMCIDILEICFEIAHWQISSILIVIFPRHDNGGVLLFHILFNV